jgi:hypothetical protein
MDGRPRAARWCALAAVLAVLAGCGSDGTSVSDQEVDELLAQPCPEYDIVRMPIIYRDRQYGGRLGGPYTAQQKAEALRWKFRILGRPLTIRPGEIDWRSDPFRSRTWLARFHGWSWMDVLLNINAESQNPVERRRAIEMARDLALDWIRKNPEDETIRWRDKIPGDRMPLLGYVMRAAACEDALSREQAGELLLAAKESADWLSDPDNYQASNHGLFMDAGLVFLSEQLEFLSDAGQWRELGANRFMETLRDNFDERAGVYLEHSAVYDFFVLELMRQMEERIDDSALAADTDRLEQTFPWLVTPQGTVTQLGDSPIQVAMPWARRAAAKLRGIAPTAEAGYGIVSDPATGGYLSVTAGYHSAFHHQADELGFELYERGQRIVADTGRYGFFRDALDTGRVGLHEFTQSSEAHSALIVDGKNRGGKEGKPYGSAIEATGSGAGWYAIDATNPVLEELQGVEQERLFLYKPGDGLVIVDRIASAEPHEYTRLVQLGPGVATHEAGRTLDLSVGGLSPTLTDTPSTGTEQRRIYRGSKDPFIGWTTAGGWDKQFTPRSTVAYVSRAADADYVTVIGVGPRGPVSGSASGLGQTTVVELTMGDGRKLQLQAVRDGSRISITERSP